MVRWHVGGRLGGGAASPREPVVARPLSTAVMVTVRGCARRAGDRTWKVAAAQPGAGFPGSLERRPQQPLPALWLHLVGCHVDTDSESG